jgi:hypothetical protein
MNQETAENEGTGALRHGDGDQQPAQRGIGRSIRPGVPVPATVLVCKMGDGALFLQGWRNGPNAYVCVEDAGQLRQALAVAFGSEPDSDNKGAS